MARRLSEHARAAKLIRQELKKHGIPASVRSESYSGGSSIRVSMDNQLPAVVKKVEAYVAQFEMGHFDGMIDLYEMSNVRNDIPQVKFVFVNNSWSAEWKQRAWDYIRLDARHVDAIDAPADYEEARRQHVRINDEWVEQAIWRILNGSSHSWGDDFWLKHKPRERIAA